MAKIKELLTALGDAEAAMSEASANLQSIRQQIIDSVSPVQRGDEVEWVVEGKKTYVKVWNVQVANATRKGGHGHKIVAYGNIIENGVETTQKVENEYPLEG